MQGCSNILNGVAHYGAPCPECGDELCPPPIITISEDEASRQHLLFMASVQGTQQFYGIATGVVRVLPDECTWGNRGFDPTQPHLTIVDKWWAGPWRGKNARDLQLCVFSASASKVIPTITFLSNSEYVRQGQS